MRSRHFRLLFFAVLGWVMLTATASAATTNTGTLAGDGAFVSGLQSASSICPAGSVVTGIQIQQDPRGFIGSAAAVCTDTAGTTTLAPAIGDGGGAGPATSSCAPGLVGLGIYGNAGNVIDLVGIRCGTVGGTPTDAAPVGGGGGGPQGPFDCPAGSVLTGLTGTFGNYFGADDVVSLTGVCTQSGTAPSTTTVACSPSSGRAGQPVTCTATVTGQGHPIGNVTFASNSSGTFSSTSCSLVTIGGNQARCSVTFTPTGNAGPVTVYANYTGDQVNAPSHSSTQITVTPSPSTTTIGCSPASVHVGVATTCTATVTGSSHPTGTVTFASNSSGTFSSTTCTLVLIGGNQARCSVTYTPTAVGTGSHKIYANYSGDANNLPSASNTTITVTP